MVVSRAPLPAPRPNCATCCKPMTRSRLAALCLASWGAVAAAEPAPIEWAVSAGARHRTLTEWSDTGAKLLTEKGPMAQLQLGAQVVATAWPALEFEAALRGGRLDYDGQTQAG